MKRLIIWLFIVLSWPALGQEAGPSSPDEALPAIAKLREGLISSFNKGDMDTLVTYLDPNVVITWQNGEVCHGTAELRAYYQKMMTGEHRMVRQLTTEPEILGRQIHGDWGVSWGNLHDHFILMDGSDLPFNSVFTATIANRGDRWLVNAFHVSVNAFDNPILSATRRKMALWFGLGIGGLTLAFGLVLGLVLGRRSRAV